MSNIFIQSEAAYSSLLPPERHIHGFLAPHSKHKSGIGPEEVFNTTDGLLAAVILMISCSASLIVLSSSLLSWLWVGMSLTRQLVDMRVRMQALHDLFAHCQYLMFDELPLRV